VTIQFQSSPPALVTLSGNNAVTVDSGTIDIASMPSVVISSGNISVTSGTISISSLPDVTIANATLNVAGTVSIDTSGGAVAVDVGTVDKITAGDLTIINNSATNIPPGSENNYSITMTDANTSYTAAPAVSSRTFFMIQNPSTETLSFGFGGTGNIFTLEPSQGYEEIVGTNPLITLAITVQGTIANQAVAIVTWE